MKYLALILALILASTAQARHGSVGIDPPPSAVNWSTLPIPVVANSNGTSGSGDDNSLALNSLPTGVTITGDCPGTGGIRIGSPWVLKSGLTILIQLNCKIYCDWPGNQGAGCLTQDDTSVALSNITIDGLYFKQIVSTDLFKGKALRFWADHLTLTNMTIDGFYAMAFVRGSDQEWQFSFINTPGGAGNDATGTSTAGFRHFGNSPKVTTTGTKPANVWVHDSLLSNTGDGALQVAPACQPGDWTNLNADDYLYERTTASGAAGNAILVANGAQEGVGLQCTNTISNIVMRNIQGASGSAAIRVQNACPSCVGSVSNLITGITFSTILMDMSPKASQPGGASVTLKGYDGATLNNVSLSNVTILNNYGQCADVSAFPSSGIMIDGMSCSQARAGSQPSIVVRAVTGITIKNSTLVTRSGGGIQLGAASQSGGALTRRVNHGNYGTSNAVIQNNTISLVSGGDSGVWLLGADAASVTGNVISKKSNATTDIGINLSTAVDANNPGATNSTVTGNTITTTIPFMCAVGQGNTVSGNTPSDCP